jgi:hypothetical protein
LAFGSRREGQLFPHVLAAAAKTMRIPAITIVESEVFSPRPQDSARLPTRSRLPSQNLAGSVGKPWSAEEKAAATAAWIALVN